MIKTIVSKSTTSTPLSKRKSEFFSMAPAITKWLANNPGKDKNDKNLHAALRVRFGRKRRKQVSPTA
jgi:hypothetical protein